jgi:hypothetical protein
MFRISKWESKVIDYPALQKPSKKEVVSSMLLVLITLVLTMQMISSQSNQ